MDFLGMRLNRHGITIDPLKIKGLTDWPRELKNIKEIRKVLGVLGYQRPFIPNFTGFARPLTNLLKKDTPFEWTPVTVRPRCRIVSKSGFVFSCRSGSYR